METPAFLGGWAAASEKEAVKCLPPFDALSLAGTKGTIKWGLSEAQIWCWRRLAGRPEEGTEKK